MSEKTRLSAAVAAAGLCVFGADTSVKSYDGVWRNLCTGESGASYSSNCRTDQRLAFDGVYRTGSSTAANCGRVLAENFPVWVKYDFGAATTVDAYTLHACNNSTDPERMPGAFALYGTDDADAVYSADMRGWTCLDRRRDEDGWIVGSHRSYRINQMASATHRYYMLVIERPVNTTQIYTMFSELELHNTADAVTPNPNARWLKTSDTYNGNAWKYRDMSAFCGRAAWAAAGSDDVELATWKNDYLIGAGMECIAPTQGVINAVHWFTGRSLTVEDGGILSLYDTNVSSGYGRSGGVHLTVRPGGVLRTSSIGSSNDAGRSHFTVYVCGGTSEKAPVFSFHSDSGTYDTINYAWRYYVDRLAGSGDIRIERKTQSLGTRTYAYTADGFGGLWSRPGAYFIFEDMKDFHGRVVLRGLEPKTNGTRYPGNIGLTKANASGQQDWSIKMEAHSTIVLNESFPLSQPVTVPIETTAGAPAQRVHAYTNPYGTMYITSPVTGGGEVTFTSCNSVWNAHKGGFTNNATIVLRDMTWGGGDIAATNVTLRLENVTLPAGTVVRNLGGDTAIEYRAVLDETREEVETWPGQLPLALFTGVTTRRTAPLLVGTHAVIKFPAGTALADLTGFTGAITGENYQASWLNAPEWAMAEDGTLSVTLTERGVYKYTKTQQDGSLNINSSSPDWYTATNWVGEVRPAAGDHCYATNHIRVAAAVSGHYTFAGDSLRVKSDRHLYLANTVRIPHLHLEAKAWIDNAWAPQGTLRGDAVTVLGDSSKPSCFRNADWRSPQTIEAPWVGGTNAVIWIGNDTGSSANRVAGKGLYLRNPSPDFHGRMLLAQDMAVSATSVSNELHFWVADERVLGAPKRFRADAVTVRGRGAVLEADGRNLEIRNPNRGITVKDSMRFSTTNGAITIASPLKLESGAVTNRGPGVLTIAGTATANADTRFTHDNATFRPLVGECFSAARLQFGTNVVLRISPDAADACFRTNGLVNTFKVAAEDVVTLDVTDVPTSFWTGRYVTRLPVLTVPTADVPALLEKLAVPELPASGLTGAKFCTRPSKNYPGCTLIMLGMGDPATVIHVR